MKLTKYNVIDSSYTIRLTIIHRSLNIDSFTIITVQLNTNNVRTNLIK